MNVGNVYHDMFIIGNIGANKIKDIDGIRKYQLVALEDEGVNRKKYLILKGYGCNIEDVTKFQYCLEVMNRIFNIDEYVLNK